MFALLLLPKELKKCFRLLLSYNTSLVSFIHCGWFLGIPIEWIARVAVAASCCYE
jgi:hypothetical protein